MPTWEEDAGDSDAAPCDSSHSDSDAASPKRRRLGGDEDEDRCEDRAIRAEAAAKPASTALRPTTAPETKQLPAPLPVALVKKPKERTQSDEPKFEFVLNWKRAREVRSFPFCERLAHQSG